MKQRQHCKKVYFKNKNNKTILALEYYSYKNNTQITYTKKLQVP